ncbi:MAG TPA: hypothetical protein VME24_00300, partial [Alphaproteobacteria bacterium]|nr:hypothetical protein [Alphaproteobacteria bacterium]
MNPDQPSREQIEARVTALLLGELPAAEAELLRWTISQDPELQKLHDHLKLTIDFVREAMKNPTGAPLEKDTPLKLRQERRETLLAHFKTVRPQPPQQSPQPPQELSWLKRIKIPSRSSLVTAAIAVFLICGLVAISIPNFVKARATSQQSACINNLRQIDAAKQEWALETHMPADAVPTPNDLTPYLAGNEIRSVAGEHYTLGKVSEPTVADFNGKRLTAGPIDLFYASADKVTSNTRRNNSADLNDSQATTISGRRTIESLNANPGTSPVTRTPAPIALPNTESSQAGSEEVAGGTAYSQGVVGYINQKVPSGAYKEFPNQLEPAPKTEPNSPFASSSSAPTEMEPDDASPFANRLQSQLAGAEPVPIAEIPPSPPAMPPQPPEQAPPTVAGGNYTVSGAAAPLPLPALKGLSDSINNKNTANGNNFKSRFAFQVTNGALDYSLSAMANGQLQAPNNSLSGGERVANG